MTIPTLVVTAHFVKPVEEARIEESNYEVRRKTDGDLYSRLKKCLQQPRAPTQCSSCRSTGWTPSFSGDCLHPSK